MGCLLYSEHDQMGCASISLAQTQRGLSWVTPKEPAGVGGTQGSNGDNEQAQNRTIPPRP